MLIGVSIGTFTAVAPQGLGIPLVYAILLPVVIKWQPVTGIALLIGASSVSAICAVYLPVLFGIPGGAGSQATILDRYPMGQRGDARRALGALFMPRDMNLPACNGTNDRQYGRTSDSTSEGSLFCYCDLQARIGDALQSGGHQDGGS
jgi:hypothetical protein